VEEKKEEEEEEEEEEKEENVVTSFVEGACAPVLRAFGSSASTRLTAQLKCRDGVKARVAMHRDRHRAIVLVIPFC